MFTGNSPSPNISMKLSRTLKSALSSTAKYKYEADLTRGAGIFITLNPFREESAADSPCVRGPCAVVCGCPLGTLDPSLLFVFG